MTYLDYRRALKLGQKPTPESARGGNSPEKPEKGKEDAEPFKPVKKAPRPIIKKVSKGRAKQNRAYTPIKRKFLQDHPICQVEGCEAPSTDLHHVRGRSGKQLLKVTDFMATCHPHHQEFEIKDKEAREAGYKKSRLGKSQK